MSEQRVLPWSENRVRKDVKQTYPLRLPEPLHLKLKFLSEEMGKSMNELCNDAVKGLVEERLRDVLEERN
jgi:predicted DNA-binding protein